MPEWESLIRSPPSALPSTLFDADGWQQATTLYFPGVLSWRIRTSTGHPNLARPLHETGAAMPRSNFCERLSPTQYPPQIDAPYQTAVAVYMGGIPILYKSN